MPIKMKTLLTMAFAATVTLAAGKVPGLQRPDPPEKAFIVTIGPGNRITVGGAPLTDDQTEAVLKSFVAATDSPAIVIQIEDIDAPGKRRHHLMAILERISARSQPFGFWFVYSPDAKARLALRRKAQQSDEGKPAVGPESDSEEGNKPKTEAEERSR